MLPAVTSATITVAVVDAVAVVAVDAAVYVDVVVPDARTVYVAGDLIRLAMSQYFIHRVLIHNIYSLCM
eukprot:10845319-Ditylum_brightwellii.AAC.1